MDGLLNCGEWNLSQKPTGWQETRGFAGRFHGQHPENSREIGDGAWNLVIFLEPSAEKLPPFAQACLSIGSDAARLPPHILSDAAHASLKRKIIR
ncbi:hypothetical protein [Rhizobium herbae]|uniref:RES domain-containing protein n=1 Tax=Rhizobium herbae TaxID=508661 RepID=A0ABS4EKE9_9HYPH|nr:hypothetical protein [Rhizobium herbae]MBP1858428.1 hypothetical protein [Rhizobium herbae]